MVFSTSSGTKFGRLHLSLLPKKVDAVQVKGFRTISLIHSFAKLVIVIKAVRRGAASYPFQMPRRLRRVARRRCHTHILIYNATRARKQIIPDNTIINSAARAAVVGVSCKHRQVNL